MPTLAVGHSRTTRTSITVSTQVTRQYQRSLRSTDLDDVPAMELLNTLLTDVSGSSAATMLDAVDTASLASDIYRDADGTLVVRQRDASGTRLSLLWPVGRRTDHPKECTTIAGADGDVFIVNSESGDVLPLPAVSAGRCAFGWGASESGAVNLYLAIVYAVSGSQAPVPRPRHRDHPDSFYGWLVRQDQRRELNLDWIDAVRMVRSDEPLRHIVPPAGAYRLPPMGAPGTVGSPFAPQATPAPGAGLGGPGNVPGLTPRPVATVAGIPTQRGPQPGSPPARGTTGRHPR